MTPDQTNTVRTAPLRGPAKERNAKRAVLAMAGSALLIFGLATPVDAAAAASAGGVVVSFPDANLLRAVNAALSPSRSAVAPVTEVMAASITELHASGVEDLTGIESMTGLTDLSVGGGQSVDLEPISGLTGLKSLDASETSIIDLDAIAGLTNLTDLNLMYTGTSDLTPLAGLTNLTNLDVQSNQVSNLDPLSGLTNLQSLNVYGNQVTGLSPLQALTNLANVQAGWQQPVVADAAVDNAADNPITWLDGSPVTVTSDSPGFTAASDDSNWSFTNTGYKTITWNKDTSPETTPYIEFSGTIYQTIGDPAVSAPSMPGDVPAEAPPNTGDVKVSWDAASGDAPITYTVIPNPSCLGCGSLSTTNTHWL